METLLIGFIVGSVLGSFVAATSYRLIHNKSLKGRSVCESCKKTIRWYDLIPVISYFILKGRCRECNKKINIEGWIVELVMGVLTALLFYQLLPSSLVITPNIEGLLLVLSVIFKSLVLVVLAIVFLVDLRTGYIYDKITYPSIAIAALYWITTSALSSFEFYKRISSLPIGTYLMPPHSNYLTNHLLYIWESALWALISGVGAALFFVLLILITKGRGMGWGDVKYVVFLGLVLNFPKIILGIFLAFLLGSVVSVALMVLGKKKIGQTIPFGPFLSAGALIALLWGDKIMSWYAGVL
jgi:leader peptidase (prepilin peptidase) / N-methyltransferase